MFQGGITEAFSTLLHPSLLGKLQTSIFTSMVELYMQQSEYKLDNRWYLFMLTMVVAVWKVISYWEVMNNQLLFYFPFP